MTSYFCYEKSATGQWNPVIYKNKPPKSVNGADPERSQFWEIEVEESLDELTKKYQRGA